MVKVSITIPSVGNKPSWTYSQEVSVPSGVVGEIPEIVIAKPSRVEMDVVKSAFNGQEVTIIASVVEEGKVSTGDEAKLIIDSEIVNAKTTGQGLVDFKWTAVPGIHTICVKVGSTQDCSQISVSSSVPEVYERLKIEREAYKEAKEKLAERRKKIREEIPSLTKGLGMVEIPGLPEAYRNMPIIIDGRTVGRTPSTDDGVQVPDISPGEHTIIISPPNAPPIEIPIVVEPGETIRIVLPVGL